MNRYTKAMIKIELVSALVIAAVAAFAEDRTRDACLEFGFGYCGTSGIISGLRWAGEDNYKWLCIGIGFAVPVGFGILHNEGQIAEYGRKKDNRLDERQIAFGSAVAVLNQLMIRWHPKVFGAELELKNAPKIQAVWRI